jgi:hypothetical protein
MGLTLDKSVRFAPRHERGIAWRTAVKNRPTPFPPTCHEEKTKI